MPVVVCLIEKKQHSPSSPTASTPHSVSSQSGREVCDARVEGESAHCHSPPVGQLFREATPNSRSVAKLVDFNQINSIFEDFLSNLTPLTNFSQILNQITTSEHMSFLSRAKREAHLASVAAFTKNVDNLNRLRALCAKDVSNLDISEVWKLLLQNYQVFAEYMKCPEKIDDNVRSLSHQLSVLQEVLNVEKAKLDAYSSVPSTATDLPLSLIPATLKEYSGIVCNAAERIEAYDKDLLSEKISVLRSRIEYHEKREFPPDHNFASVLTNIVHLDGSFVESSIERVLEVIEWYTLMLEIESAYFNTLISMQHEIMFLQETLRNIGASLHARFDPKDLAADLTEREKFGLRNFITEFQRVFSRKNFQKHCEIFRSKRKSDYSDLVTSAIEQGITFPKSKDEKMSQLREQDRKVKNIEWQISIEKQKKDLWVESKATLSLCQFYNSQHTFAGRDLHCYLFKDMNKVFSRYFSDGFMERLKLEHVFFLRSKYLFPVALIERLNQIKQIMCDLTPNAIRALLLMQIKDLLSDLRSAMVSKSHEVFHTRTFKNICRQSIEFLDRTETMRVDLSGQLRDLAQSHRISECLFDDHTDYLQRSPKFVLAEILNRSIDVKAPLVVSHTNYVESDLLVLCLHYLNYAWGYAHRGQEMLRASAVPVLLYANPNPDDFYRKLDQIFSDQSTPITQIIFMFGDVHFVGGCIRSFGQRRKFVFLDSGDMPVIPNSHLLKTQECCAARGVEFDNQIGQRKQIGANCAFIAIETIAFLSQPDLDIERFSAVSVSAYIAQAMGITRGIQAMQGGVQGTILSPEGQAFAGAVHHLMLDGRLRLRLRWALFAQQAYTDPGFTYLEQYLSDLISFDEVILDPDLSVYCRAGDADEGSFLRRMRSDCFPLPNKPFLRSSASSSSSPNGRISSSSSSSSSSSRSRSATTCLPLGADPSTPLDDSNQTLTERLSRFSVAAANFSYNAAKNAAKLAGLRKTSKSSHELSRPSASSDASSYTPLASSSSSPDARILCDSKRLGEINIESSYFGTRSSPPQFVGSSSAGGSIGTVPFSPLSPAMTPVRSGSSGSSTDQLVFSPASSTTPTNNTRIDRAGFSSSLSGMGLPPAFSSGSSSPTTPVSSFVTPRIDPNMSRDFATHTPLMSPHTEVVLQPPPHKSKKKVGWGEWIWGSSGKKHHS